MTIVSTAIVSMAMVNVAHESKLARGDELYFLGLYLPWLNHGYTYSTMAHESSMPEAMSCGSEARLPSRERADSE